MLLVAQSRVVHPNPVQSCVGFMVEGGIETKITGVVRPQAQGFFEKRRAVDLCPRLTSTKAPEREQQHTK
jgi:hypothetical protein